MGAGVQPDEGPLTIADLQAIWTSSVDPLYAEPLLEKGDGGGIEAFDQAFAQLERVSTAVDVSTQAMFILPWSGQTNDPARGPAKARVTLTVQRTQHLDLPMVMSAGVVLIEEQTTDWGPDPGDGAQVILTGRRYSLVTTLVFPPGVAGPLTIVAEAERPGWGYNNPRPNTLTEIAQPGVDYENVGASVQVLGGTPVIVAQGVPDVFIPQHVGQYVLMTGGTNVGTIAHISGYGGPVGTDGGRIMVDREITFWGTAAGTFQNGERVKQATSGAEGVVVGSTTAYLVITPALGTFNAVNTITGLTSGATFAINSIARDNGLVAEVATAAWRIFSWTDDWGVTVTNLTAPAGGRLGFLDELGRERNVRRGPNESDLQYRDRVSKVADVVSPNALIRAANRILVPLGLTGCFREAGQLSLPGVYFDQDFYDVGESFTLSGLTPFDAFIPGEEVQQLDPATGKIAHGKAIVAYVAAGNPSDTLLDGVAVEGGVFQENLAIVGQRSGASYVVPPGTFVGLSTGSGVKAADRYRWFFDILEMRAFFIETVPRVNFGDFGFAYDVDDARGFYEVGFYDGFPAGAGAFYRTLWMAQENIKAGGVGHDIVQDDGPCL